MSQPIKNFDLDLWQRPISTLHLVQHESAGRDVQLTLVDSGKPYDLTGKAVMLEVKKPDNNVVVMTCDVVSAAAGVVKATITSQAVILSGEGTAQVRITAEGQLTKSFPIRMLISPSIDADGIAPSTPEFSALQDLIVDVQSWEHKIDDLDARVDQIITTPAESVSAQEIIDARAGAATLGARLDADNAEKVQNFKLKNEVVNGDFSQGTTGWTPTLSTNSVSDGKLINTGNGTQIYPYVVQTLPIPRVVGNKIYVRADMRTLDECDYITIQLKSGSVLATKTSPVINEIYKLSGVFTEDTNTGDTILVLQHVYPSPASNSLGKRLEIDNVLAVNLTSIFGAGNEPTKLEMDRLVEMVPNQWWDGELDLTQQQYVNWLLSFIREKANKVQDAWTKATLLNGWTGNLYYRKNQLGEMEFYGNGLVAGTAALNTIIAATPTGSRVLANMLPMATYDAITGNVLHINARGNGNIVLGNGFTTGRTYHLAGSYATA